MTGCVHMDESLFVCNAFMQDYAVDIDQALFQPFPSEITFQKYQPHQTYEFPLFLRNLDVVAHHVKVTMKKSEYFFVVGKAPMPTKIAPGMEATYIIHFTPTSDKVNFSATNKNPELHFITCCSSPIITRITLTSWCA